jgi:RimJ/RimL family protein N-acetyltransferase
MTLEVFDTNERARHVYRKLGYEEVGRIPKAVSKDGWYFDSIIMAKEIT